MCIVTIFKMSECVFCGFNYYEWYENDEVQLEIQQSQFFKYSKYEKNDVEINLKDKLLKKKLKKQPII